eukprot:TRINITY_DN5651_c0_g5_i1.p1 TRINITY_DN5651_c0_g5~~TRINITY_DN5651_c0_g5_i1.p1  ORF type:complete len:987 (-),score=194.36 TRINITY_DN5651_c0_g5_i1:169-3129(-)
MERVVVGGSLLFVGDTHNCSVVSDPFAFSLIDRVASHRALSLWIYAIGLSNKASQRIVQTKSDGFSLSIAPLDVLSLHLSPRDGEKQSLCTNAVLKRNHWHHIALQQTGSDVTLWFDGACVKSASVSSPIFDNTPFLLGSKNLGVISHVSVHQIQDSTHEQWLSHLKLNPPTYPPDTRPALIPKAAPLTSIQAIEGWTASDPINKPTIALQQRQQNHNGIKVIHCHDMRGGYVDDDDPNGVNHANIYNFKYWQFVDTFIYFSHHRLSIPPLSWIHAAHKNGVRIMGTYITEWDEGEKETVELLCGFCLQESESSTDGAKKSKVDAVIEKLVEIAEYYKLDGWFLNIENKITQDLVEGMKAFVGKLTKAMKSKNPEWTVIWYDSVTVAGDLKWQNQLNDLNCCYFDECDGFFANYGWTAEYPTRSVSLRPDRAREIYMGIDIFGRGTYGGGGFNAIEALKVIDTAGTSVALFAPGWTFESNKGQDGCRLRYETAEDKFWIGAEWKDLMDGRMSKFESEGWHTVSNEGNGWKTNSGSRFGNDLLVTSYGWNSRGITFDLVKDYGFTPSFLDEIQPRIIAEEWFKGTGPNFRDLYYLKIQLKDQDHNIIQEFETGIQEAGEEWKSIKKEFKCYGSGVRYIYWEDGGKDVEYWAGHYGTQLDGASLLIENRDAQRGSIATKIEPRAVPTRLPFYTNFSQGVGQKYFRQGRIERVGQWGNLLEQEAQPTHNDRPLLGNQSIRCYGPDYETAYDGGNSWAWIGSFDEENQFSVQHAMDVHLETNTGVAIEYSTNPSEGSDLYVILELSNKTHIHLHTHPLGMFSEGQCITIPPASSTHDPEQNGWFVHRFILAADVIGENHICRLFACIFRLDSGVGPVFARLGHLLIEEETEVDRVCQLTDASATPIWNSASLEQGRHLEDFLLEWKTEGNVAFVDIMQGSVWLGRSYNNSFLLKGDKVTSFDGFILKPCHVSRRYGIESPLNIKSSQQKD